MKKSLIGLMIVGALSFVACREDDPFEGYTANEDGSYQCKREEGDSSTDGWVNVKVICPTGYECLINRCIAHHSLEEGKTCLGDDLCAEGLTCMRRNDGIFGYKCQK